MNSGPHIRTRVSRGWVQMSERMKEGMRRQPQQFDAEACLRWDNLQIQAAADMAWVSYDVTAIEPVEGIASADFQHETKILHRVDGTWKLVCVIILVPRIGRNDTPRIELGRNRDICHINTPARDRLADHPGLVTAGTRIRARNRAFDPGFQREIDGAVERPDSTLALGHRPRTVAAVPLGEDDFGHPLHCWVTNEHERVLVTFDDAHMTEDRLEQAAAVYALSAAQHRLAKLLATGNDLGTAAEATGVSVNTVRTQVRRMFEKTGTHNQTELISMLLSVQRPS